jgi:hypothetical protein
LRRVKTPEAQESRTATFTPLGSARIWVRSSP